MADADMELSQLAAYISFRLSIVYQENHSCKAQEQIAYAASLHSVNAPHMLLPFGFLARRRCKITNVEFF